MTHTLHREGNQAELARDFVLNIVPATGLNEEGAGDKIRQFFRLLMNHHPVNFGIKRVGQMYQAATDELIEKIPGRTHSHNCVLVKKEDLVEFLKELKEADFGLSVVVTGIYDAIKEHCKEAGLKPHTVNFSLGVWGKTDKLPPPKVRKITTMCGHGMISSNLVIHMANEVKKGSRTAKEAAIEIARPCYCGIVNVTRVASILEELAQEE
jgi:acetylglutamate kinase